MFEIGDTWLLNPSQAGVFCMDAAALEKATSGRPEPKVFDPESAAEALSARIREKIGDVSQFIPTEASLAEIAEAFAAAAREICGVDLDFQPDSLDRLRDLQYRLSARNSALLLGIGACYGETIRRSFGAEWKLKPVPFADWAPRGTYEDNPLVQVVLPFTDAVASSLDSESYGMWSGDSFAEREQGQKVILVYPPSHAAAAAREAAGEDYFKARTLLDEGKVKDALDLLVKEMERRPRNRALAQTVIGICEAAEMPDAVLILTRRAVDAGSEVPDLLVRYADDLAKTDPARALPYYRKACSEYWQPAETLIKTGDAYAAAGNPAVAESCWRRAWRNAEEGEKREIRRRMGIPEPESE